MIKIVPVNSKKELATFIDFPHALFAGDPNYVPELFIAQRDLLTPGKHPFHEHAKVQLFLAYNEGKLEGRIAAILNGNHNQFNNATDGFFGFYDVTDNVEVSDALLREAAAWVKEKGATTLIGPVNPSTNETCGVLIEGFGQPPVAMMTYNKPYYPRLLEHAGLHKKIDLFAWWIESNSYNDRSVRLQAALEQRLNRHGITIRPVNVKDFKNETAKLREVYNAAWDSNLGFVPFTENEFNYLAKDLKMLLDPKFCLVAEHEGKIVGFGLAIPDVNQILIKIKKGRLLPFGILKLLTGMKKVNSVRVLALGVVEGYRKLGIEACFYAAIIKRGLERNMKGAEASWILEHNELMNKGIESVNGRVYKKYRIYEKAI
jgi:GNAT superfamily N-acetyltransferase